MEEQSKMAAGLWRGERGLIIMLTLFCRRSSLVAGWTIRPIYYCNRNRFVTLKNKQRPEVCAEDENDD